MSIDLSNYEEQTHQAIKHFWMTRESSLSVSSGGNQGERGGGVAGKNMDGFLDLIRDVVLRNGLTEVDLHVSKQSHLTLPGFFRPTKKWDVLIVHREALVAAIGLNSQIEAFDDNFNNRCEEALSSSIDLWAAFRAGAFGQSPRPFVGYLMLLEDCMASRSPVNDKAFHFPILPEFQNASYTKHYKILFEKLIRERLYDAATILVSPGTAIIDGAYEEMSQLTGMRQFIAALASHVAIAAAFTWKS